MKKTNKDLSFKARGLVAKAGSEKNIGKGKAYFLKIRRKVFNGKVCLEFRV